MAALQNQGIQTQPLFPPFHTQPIYDTGQSLPVAEHIAAIGLSLPSAVRLQEYEINRVVEAIIKIKSSYT